MSASKKLVRKLSLGVLLCLSATALFTCEPVPEYCGNGTGPNSWLKDGQFCFGDAAYNLCGGNDYNPLTEGCDQNNEVGTRCSNGSIVPKDTPCGGYAIATDIIPTEGGDITRTPDAANYAAGEKVVLTAFSRDGYEFIGWSGDLTSASPTVIITMSGTSANKAFVAIFKPIDAPGNIMRKLITTAFPENGGIVACSPESAAGIYDAGTKVTVTATAKPGYAFNVWAGASTIASSTVVISMDESKALVAVFTPVAYTQSPPETPNPPFTPAYLERF